MKYDLLKFQVLSDLFGVLVLLCHDVVLQLAHLGLNSLEILSALSVRHALVRGLNEDLGQLPPLELANLLKRLGYLVDLGLVLLIHGKSRSVDVG